jgi:glycerol 2-dehydrogenase (NADP+)
LTTKLDNDAHNRVKEALDYSLTQLDTPYLDLWLMHWPAPMISPPSLGKADKSIDWLDTWKEMENVYLANKDKVRAIGVGCLVKSKWGSSTDNSVLGVQLFRQIFGSFA